MLNESVLPLVPEIITGNILKMKLLFGMDDMIISSCRKIRRSGLHFKRKNGNFSQNSELKGSVYVRRQTPWE